MQTARIVYNDKIVRQFVAASVLWGIVGMLVGVLVALQLSVWQLNLGPWLSFGRLRPLHTNAVIFAFVGNMMFAGVYYSTQRLCKARLASDALSQVHFWGWQLIIVSAALTLPLGITTGKEYAELEWPIDIAIAVVWVVFAINFFWTLAKRNEKHLYVALWFYIATIATVAVLHIVNSLEIPVGALKSYSIFAGVQDALVQWWYGHNAVAFFLTTPILGIMYYFLPKAAERPVFSYRLSIVHFWALVFLYIWAGPHHLLYTALPDWAQSLGMIFSLMLWAPSWGGMLNGLLTLRGAWDKVRADPVLKFFAAGVTFYGMATFEGPLLSIKSVNQLAHYSDWIIGHVHSGALGWNGLMAAGLFYWLVPRLFGTQLYSKKLADYHFYLGTIGILVYVVAMWVSGIRQGLMLRELNELGGLKYTFVETIVNIQPMYWARAIAGAMYLAGMILMAYNLFVTARSGKAVDGETEVAIEESAEPKVAWAKVVFGTPVILSIVVCALLGTLAVTAAVASTFIVVVAFAVAVSGILAMQLAKVDGKPTWHRLLEGRPLIFTVLAVVSILVGGAAEIIPTVAMGVEERRVTQNVPYTALQLEGRDTYLQEGCYVCHSQMVRPFSFEEARYGAPSRTDDSVFDHPFQWGSRRTGPDLARVGTRGYDNLWHWTHLMDPRSRVSQSLMPGYAHLATERVDFARTSGKLAAMRSVGVPYTDAQIDGAAQDAQRAARVIADDLRERGNVTAEPDCKAIALIAYLQRLGRRPGEGDGAGATQGVAAATPARTGGE